MSYTKFGVYQTKNKHFLNIVLLNIIIYKYINLFVKKRILNQYLFIILKYFHLNFKYFFISSISLLYILSIFVIGKFIMFWCLSSTHIDKFYNHRAHREKEKTH